MRKKGLFVAALLLLLFGGCNSVSSLEEPEMSTQAPEAVEQEESSGGLYSDVISYIDKSKQAMDQNQADAVEIVIEAACMEAQIQGMAFPQEPIRFRYTNELGELSDSYGLLKQAIRDLMGDEVIELKVEGNYLMVEISGATNGTPKVEVELLHE